jgi:hypothetical protein
LRRTLASSHDACLRDTGQARKGAWWMPRHWEAKKDVDSCDKLRGAANRLGSGDFRIGKPDGDEPSVRGEYIASSQPTRGTETSKYPVEKKSTEIPLVVASERGTA